MDGTNLLEVHHWQPFAAFGLEGSLFTFNSHTLIFTWIACGLLLVTASFAYWALHNPGSKLHFAVVYIVNELITFVHQSLGFFTLTHVSFIGTLFLFTAYCSCLSLIPWMEEPTQDLNTTLALGIVSFIYVQASAIYAHGIRGYIHEYFTPFIIMFPLHVLGKLATIVSMSFRLFGNIFGGATITGLWFSAIKGIWWLEIIGLMSVNIIVMFFFGLFEGLLQAFVITMLSLTYLSLALQPEETEHE